MKRNLQKSSVFSVAMCAMMSALAIIIMAIGAILEIADLASAMFASLLIWFIQIEFSASYAVLSFAVSSLLSFLFLPSILPAFYFTLLYGWYPPLKYLLDTKIKQKQICFIVKKEQK